jgi:hypothetical protein
VDGVSVTIHRPEVSSLEVTRAAVRRVFERDGSDAIVSRKPKEISCCPKAMHRQ